MKLYSAMIFLSGCMAFVNAGDEPEQAELTKKPQWQRLLAGDDAKKAEELLKRITELEFADDYPGAIKSAEELLALRSRVQGADHHESITTQFTLQTLRAVAKLDAQERHSWRVTNEELEEAKKLTSQARYAAALLIQQEILETRRKVLGEANPDTAESFNEIAFNLYAQGKAAEAQPFFEKALTINRKTLGEAHVDTATCYNNLASNLDAQGKVADAESLYRTALELRCTILGEEHANTATSYNNLAYNLQAQGQSEHARPLYLRALEISRKVFGEEHPNTAMFYNNVAYNLVAQGKAREAQPFYQKALEITRKVFGDDHLTSARGFNNLASNLDNQGKATEAQPLYRKALEITRKVLGEEHPHTALSYNNVAANLTAQGKTAEAQPLYQMALDINRKVLGEEHPLTARSHSNLAINLQDQGKTIEAQSLLQQALDITRKVLGDEHPDTAQSYINLASNLRSQGKRVEAQPLYQKALDIRRKVLGDEHPTTANSFNSIAFNLHDLGKAADAEPLYQKALEIRINVLGEEHPDTASSYNIVAYNLHAQGKGAEAHAIYLKALEIRRKVLGEQHPDTASSYNDLALNLAAQAKHAEAKTVLQRAIFAFEASRFSRAHGIERSIGERFNPRLLLVTIELTNDPMAAWRNVEATLARGLLDEQAPTRSLSTEVEAAEANKLQSQIAEIQPQILALVTNSKRTDEQNARLEQLLKDRRETEERLATLDIAVSTREVVAGEATQAALPTDAALLFWIDVTSKFGDVEQHWACIVTREGQPKWQRLPGSGENGMWTKEDSALPDKFLEALGGNALREEVDALAKRLHAQRVAPILEHLGGVKRLYCVPAHAMAGIPVEALTDRFVISYIPSGSYLARLKNLPRPASSGLLALGDPIFDTEKKEGASLSALPSGGLLITQVTPGGVGAKARLRSGDVLLKYGEMSITTIEELQKAISAHQGSAKIPLTVWRETDATPFTCEVGPGPLGVVLDREPAPAAIVNRRKTDVMLASIRGGQWKDLPGTRVEISRLEQLFGGTTKLLADSEASEQTLESLRKSGDLTKYRYLHFATHGEGNDVRAFESSLILSQDQVPLGVLPKSGEPFLNGQVSAREVLDFWKLNAELVTLSACETAIGKEGSGDGSLGFAQAFLTAGARSVCLSVWNVDDTATALLMSRFYENLLGRREDQPEPMGKAAALDEAKRWLRNLTTEEVLTLSAKISNGVSRGKRGKDVRLNVVARSDSKDTQEKPFAHPKYWSAFVLIGEPD